MGAGVQRHERLIVDVDTKNPEKRPDALEFAPVNAPFLCPNNSDSIRLSGRAAQFSVIKFLLARGLAF
jgi:hypothetical protein